MPQPVLDCVGNEITGSSVVVYPVRKGSNMWMNRAQVKEIEFGVEPVLGCELPNGHRVRIKNIKNVAVVVPPAPPAV